MHGVDMEEPRVVTSPGGTARKDCDHSPPQQWPRIMEVDPPGPEATDAEKDQAEKDETPKIAKHLRHLEVTCTKRVDSSCRLLRHRRCFNHALLDIGLEICEDARCDSENGVRIAITQASGRGYVFDGIREDSNERDGLDVVGFLLSEHRCITTVEMNCIMRHCPLLLKALRLNRDVECVVISGMDPEGSAEDVAAFKAVKSMSQLKGLFFDTERCPPKYTSNLRLHGQLLRGGTRQLTALDVASVEMSPKQAKRLIGALTRNRTVTHLVVGENVFTSGKELSGANFANYLVNTATLRALKLISKPEFTSERVIRTLARAVCQMTTLEELEVDLDIKMVGFSARVALFAQVVAENSTLRRLRLPSVACGCSQAADALEHLDPPDPDAAEKMAHLARAVRSNSVLRTLEIDLGGFGVGECREFFNAVGDNATLISVIVRRLPAEVEVDGICKTIRDRGLKDRVRIEHHHLTPLDIDTLPRCPEITGVTLNGRHFAGDMTRCKQMIDKLASCPHVTSVRVDTWYFSDSTYKVFTDYVTKATTLRELEVNVAGIPEARTDEAHLKIERELMYAVGLNPSLIEVNITGILLYNKYCTVLVDAVAAQCGRLTHLRITPANTMNPTYANLFMPHLVNRPPRHVRVDFYNYKNSGHASLREITARNNNNVSAATRYVLGDWKCDDGARVLELLHDHPSLVRNVRRKAELGTVEADARIARALKRVRRCDLDEYMRLAGVVKRRVVCTKQKGVRLQIADINEYCWLHLRLYLKVADVVRV
nr:uncharacterized protein LOC126525994 [Dermacentor andersoni]